MKKIYKAEKEICNIINSEVWIELKSHFWIFKFTQKIIGMTIYKVLHYDKEYVFASKYARGADDIYILNDALKQKSIERHRKYIGWTGDYKTLFQESFMFLLRDYDFSFNYMYFKNAVDKNDKFFYYGPVYCASFFKEGVSINFILLVQRGEWDVYVGDKFTTIQSEIRGGRYLSDGFLALKSFNKYDEIKHVSTNANYIALISQCIHKEISIYNEVYGITLNK